MNRTQLLFDHVTKWVKGKADILGVALVGSYARNQARPDSDVDLILIADTPEVYIDHPEWIEEFGKVRSRSVEDWGLVTSLRVFYEGGLEVEYGLTSPEWGKAPIDEGTRRVILDGIQILLDKNGLLARALSEAKKSK